MLDGEAACVQKDIGSTKSRQGGFLSSHAEHHPKKSQFYRFAEAINISARFVLVFLPLRVIKQEEDGRPFAHGAQAVKGPPAVPAPGGLGARWTALSQLRQRSLAAAGVLWNRANTQRSWFPTKTPKKQHNGRISQKAAVVTYAVWKVCLCPHSLRHGTRSTHLRFLFHDHFTKAARGVKEHRAQHLEEVTRAIVMPSAKGTQPKIIAKH